MKVQTIQIPLVNIDHFTNNLNEKDRRSQKKQQFDLPTVNTNLIRCQIIIAVGPRITICPHLQETNSWMSGGIYFPDFTPLAEQFVSCLPEKVQSLFYNKSGWFGLLILFSRSEVKHLQPSHVFRLKTNQCSCYHVQSWFCHVPMSAKVFH